MWSGLFGGRSLPNCLANDVDRARTTKASLQIFSGTLLPAASITGAPKRAAMSHSIVLETPRGIYTGAIGYIAPNRKAQFSIAIRTSSVTLRSAR